MNKKILNVVSVFFSVPFFFGDQLLHFNKKGFEIHVICSPSEKLHKYSLLKKFKYKEFLILRQFSIVKDIKTIFSIRKYIIDNDIKIVSGHTAKGSLLGIFAAFLARVPKRIYFRHGFYYETSKGFKKILMLNIDRFTSLLSTQVVCVSPYVLEKSLEYRLTKSNKLKLLNIGSCNGVDCDNKFNPENIKSKKRNFLKETLEINKEDFIIGYTGRLVKDKGIVELVDSFKILSKEYSNIKLLLVGPFEDRDSIPIKIKKEILDNKNIFAIGLVDEDIEYYYSLMSVLILPTHREGLGTSLLEASSMEIPVITTSHTGSRDAVKENVSGVYIDITSKSIVKKIQDYIENPNLVESHGKNGRIFIRENFNQKIIWNEIEKLYLE